MNEAIRGQVPRFGALVTTLVVVVVPICTSPPPTEAKSSGTSTAGLAWASATRIHGKPDAYIGQTVAGVGDVNGDGRPDLAIGLEPRQDGTQLLDGVYIAFGPLPPGRVAAQELPGFRIETASAQKYYAGQPAMSVAAAGDVNGDGLADIAVTSAKASTFTDPSGFSPRDEDSYVVFGSKASDRVRLEELGVRGFQIRGALDRTPSNGQSFNVFAQAVGVGDFNGDGLGDLTVRSPLGSTPGRPGSGVIYVVFGRSSTDAVDLHSLGGGGLQINGEDADRRIGESEVAGGDVNGDGRSDVIIGVRDGAGSPAAHEPAYVVFGGSSTEPVDLASLDGRGFRIEGISGFASTVAAVGDVNGDRRDDIAVASGGAGRAYVVFGRSQSIDVRALGTGGFAIEAADPRGGASYRLGGQVVGPGDVNGDGRPDVVVGSHDPLYGISGRIAYVIFGTGSRETVRVDLLGGHGYGVDPATPSGAELIFTAAGDQNGDGHADLLFGVPADPGSRCDERGGSVYLLTGALKPQTAPAYTRYGNRGNRLRGSKGDDQIFGGGGNDVLRGRGGNDCLIGGDEDAPPSIDSPGFWAPRPDRDRIYGGKGDDSLFGGPESDRLIGGPGDDRLYGANPLPRWGASGRRLPNRVLLRRQRDVLRGGPGRDSLFGAYRLYGGLGRDHITGRGLLVGGGGKDDIRVEGPGRVRAGAGDDFVNSANRVRNVVDCGGGGKDVVTADQRDRLRGCERVNRVAVLPPRR
jgi:Ca2+-binding RTX toxin-like protein